MINNYHYYEMTRRLPFEMLAILTMKEFLNLFAFTGGMANLLCLLSSYEVETKGGRRLVILLRGSLTIDLNRSCCQVFLVGPDGFEPC